MALGGLGVGAEGGIERQPDAMPIIYGPKGKTIARFNSDVVFLMTGIYDEQSRSCRLMIP